MLNHNYIGTEHILLGLVHEGDGVAAMALKSMDISLEAVRAEVEEIIGQGQAAPGGHIPFTPRAKKVLELALREALQLGHTYIGTEHILLGLVREGEGVAAQVLVKMGADLRRVRTTVLELLAGYGPGPQTEPAAEAELGVFTELSPEMEATEGSTVVRDVPVCGTCGSSLSRTLRLRTFPSTEADEQVSVRTAYCNDCGTVIGVVP